MSDALDLIVSVLQDNWNETNCTKPMIDYSHNILYERGSDYDVIIVYRTARARERADMQYNYQTTIDRISIDMRVESPDYDHFISLVNETVRCIHQSRKDPDATFHRIDIVNETDHNIPKRAFRKVIDLEVWNFVDQIVTT